jgi:hypothetical protein
MPAPVSITNRTIRPVLWRESYPHFATGLHVCLDRYTSQILKPLLKLPSLHPAGAPEYNGTFPQKLLVNTS